MKIPVLSGKRGMNIVQAIIVRAAEERPRGERREDGVGGGERDARSREERERSARARAEARERSRSNSKLYLTVANEESAGVPCFPTRDPHDRAHQVMDAGGMLVPSTAPNVHARARRYPRCVMTSSGVAHDSSFDGLHKLQCKLHGVDGVGIQAQATVASLRYESGEGERRDGLTLMESANRNAHVYECASPESLVRAYADAGLVSRGDAEAFAVRARAATEREHGGGVDHS